MLRKPAGHNYSVRWFDPVNNKYSNGTGSDDGNILTVTSPKESDMVLILEEVVTVKNIRRPDRRNVIRDKN